jgi:hypothetical protein
VYGRRIWGSNRNEVITPMSADTVSLPTAPLRRPKTQCNRLVSGYKPYALNPKVGGGGVKPLAVALSFGEIP